VGSVDGAAGSVDGITGCVDNEGRGGPAVMAGWGPVDDGLAARLSCDATLQQLWLHLENGLPLKLGRAYRNTPAPLRRALAARDPYCRWPGCHIPANWCDSHHLREWIRDHGETNVENLVLLCRYHHVCMHERGWRMFREPRSGWIWIMRPDGRRYELGPSRPRVDGTPSGGRSGESRRDQDRDQTIKGPPVPPPVTPPALRPAVTASPSAPPQSTHSELSPSAASASVTPPATTTVRTPRVSTDAAASPGAPTAPPNMPANRSRPVRTDGVSGGREGQRRLSRGRP
jgi:hypothetical protein